MKVKEMKLLHALDPKAKAEYEASQKTTAGQFLQIIAFWAVIGAIAFAFALFKGWV